MAWTQTGQLKAPVAAEDITDATTVGQAVLTAADEDAARTAIGAAAAEDLADVATTGDATDLGGVLGVSQAPVGIALMVHCLSGTWQARSTSRTNVSVIYLAHDVDDPDPTDFVAGVDVLLRPQA